MVSFGLISEGPTDQIVIESILFGVFDNPDLPITALQPKPQEAGNWVRVFDYCASSELKSALTFNDFLIIQIDTDILFREQLPGKYKIELSNDLSVEAIIEKVVLKFIDLIDDGNGFWTNYGDRIIFAISVHSIECWLLPIYFNTQHQKAGKITGCLDTLNKILIKQEGFSIHEKEAAYYVKIAKKLRKQINDIYTLNPSLRIFVENIKGKNIETE